MTNSFKLRTFLLASLIALTPAAGIAQGNASNTTDATANATMNADTDTMGTTAPMAATTVNDMAYEPTAQPVREDHDFPWGLLGLLGLAGLLGRKKRDDDHLHVDRTGEPRNNRM